MGGFAVNSALVIFGLFLGSLQGFFPVASSFEFKHHDNRELLQVLETVHQTCPNITRIYTLSETSVMGVPLYVIEFATQPGQHEALRPEFKYIANMHGNEVLGRELLLKLADYLCEQYRANDPEIRSLISKTRIHLLPSMNPDGWKLSTDQGGQDYLLGRSNANSVDLNRDFPDLDRIIFGNEVLHINHNNHLMDQLTQLDHPVQPETLAVMRLIMSIPFALSANMHGGDLVANYPYDASRSGASSEYTETPDDETFRYLSLSYSLPHPTMASPKRRACELNDGENFGKTQGIVNGAKWYSVRGGMQDFNYLSSNDFEITLELGCKKYPPQQELQGEWNANKASLINFMWQVHTGVKGIVRDSIAGKPISNALIHVKNITQINSTHAVSQHINHDVTSVFDGDYFRLLTPGQYLLTASYSGYKPQTRRVKVQNPRHHEATRLDFWLEPVDSSGPEFVPLPSSVEAEVSPKSNGYFRDDNPLTNDFSQIHGYGNENQEANQENLTPPSKDWLVKFMYQQIANM
ncbi:unnamed protein product [Allacma fusca]|uniref:Peptidase M14 domain-containing protein n=1 Tax=Allacma fusca TaxID=39272 RepID=A0A8J2PNK5_9HEXA|nr:unnamed protein product [Allacma fusca]